MRWLKKAWAEVNPSYEDAVRFVEARRAAAWTEGRHPPPPDALLPAPGPWPTPGTVRQVWMSAATAGQWWQRRRPPMDVGLEVDTAAGPARFWGTYPRDVVSRFVVGAQLPLGPGPEPRLDLGRLLGSPPLPGMWQQMHRTADRELPHRTLAVLGSVDPMAYHPFEVTGQQICRYFLAVRLAHPVPGLDRDVWLFSRSGVAPVAGDEVELLHGADPCFASQWEPPTRSWLGTVEPIWLEDPATRAASRADRVVFDSPDLRAGKGRRGYADAFAELDGGGIPATGTVLGSCFSSGGDTGDFYSALRMRIVPADREPYEVRVDPSDPTPLPGPGGTVQLTVAAATRKVLGLASR